MEILRISEWALQCRQLDQFRKEIPELLSRTMNAERVTYIPTRLYPSPRLDFEHMITRGIDRKYLFLFADHYYKTDPFFIRMTDRDTVVTTEDVTSWSDLEESEYYNDFLKPQAMFYQMAVYLRSGGKLLGVIDFSRGRHESCFSPLEIAKAQMLRPHIAGALERSILMDKAEKTEQIINSICPDLPYGGIVVVDETLEPVFVSEEARRTLCVGEEKTESPRSEMHSGLPKQVRLKCQALYEEARRHRRAVDGGEVKISGKAGEMPVSASLSLVECGRHPPLCLIRLNEQGSPSGPAVYLKRAGLSSREAEVACCVCEGLKNREIGEKLFISEYTVENHLRAIYDKLGVRNRTGLLHKVAHFTPVAPEVPHTNR